MNNTWSYLLLFLAMSLTAVTALAQHKYYTRTVRRLAREHDGRVAGRDHRQDRAFAETEQERRAERRDGDLAQAERIVGHVVRCRRAEELLRA